MKELNESQRAGHAESQLRLVQEQLRRLEARNEELEAKFGEVTKANLELQAAERELRDQVVSSVSREEVHKMEKKIEVRIDVLTGGQMMMHTSASNAVRFCGSRSRVMFVENEPYRTGYWTGYLITRVS